MIFAQGFEPAPAPIPRTGFPVPGPQSPTGCEVMHDIFFLTPEDWSKAADKVYDHVVIGSSFCALAFAKQAFMVNPKCNILLLERGSFFLPAHFQTLPMAMAATLGGKSETFPWTVDVRTATGKDGVVQACHGSVPFFGGRSTVWSTWCPKPTADEMYGWPEATIAAAINNFDFAEELLRVQATDQVDVAVRTAASDIEAAAILNTYTAMRRPVYGEVQRVVFEQLAEDAVRNQLQQNVGIDRVEYARLASSDKQYSGVDFLKYSVPGDLLQLKREQPSLDIKLDCLVTKVLNQKDDKGNYVALALETSAGVLPLNGANLVLAMGALPPATLVRNSFPGVYKEEPAQFSAHFISSITARLPRKHLVPDDLQSHQVGAVYISGTAHSSYKRQFHIQLSIIADPNPDEHASSLMRYMPDVVATASKEQLATSHDYVIFVCAVLGEMDVDNPKNKFSHNPQDANTTTNSLLRAHSSHDLETWDAMDKATFAVLETIAGDAKAELQYWHPTPVQPWRTTQPTTQDRRVPVLVHEGSTLPIGDKVDLDYKLSGTDNVYVTGAGLWPRGGSWNPTYTMVALAADLAKNVTKAPS